MYGRADVSTEHRQIVTQRSDTTDTEQKFILGSLNFATMKKCVGEVVEAMARH